jgi:hypothetical protein
MVDMGASRSHAATAREGRIGGPASIRWVRCALPVLLLSGLWACGAQAGTNEDRIIAHFEFLGYTCDRLEQGIRARHPSKIHILFSVTQGGILLQTGFPGKQNAEEGSRYALLNTVNARLRAARVYWTKEGHLVASTWMPGEYDKARFSAFMEAWEQDVQVLREFSQDLKPYLSE